MLFYTDASSGGGTSTRTGFLEMMAGMYRGIEVEVEVEIEIEVLARVYLGYLRTYLLISAVGWGRVD